MLSASARSTLLQLANNTTLIGQTQQRISSGRKFNSVIEGGSDFLKARGHQKSADELLGYKQNMDDGLSIIKSTMDGVKSSKSMLQQLRSVAEDAQNGSLTEALATNRAGSIVSQYDNLVGDTGVHGVNLVNGSLAGEVTYDPKQWQDLTAEMPYANFSVSQNYEYDGKLWVSGEDTDTSTSKVLTYDGTNWTDLTVELPYADFSISEYRESGGNLWVSGVDQATSNTRILTYDGTNWEDLTPDSLGYSSFSLSKVSETSDGRIILSGRDTIAAEYKTLIHDGSTWTDLGGELGVGYTSFSMNSFEEYDGGILIQGSDFSDGYHSRLIQYDGTTVTDVNATLGVSEEHNFRLKASSDNLMTFYSSYYSGGFHKKIISFDGTDWTDVSAQFGLSDSYLYEAAALGDETMIFTRDGGALIHDGSSWSDLDAAMGVTDYEPDKVIEYNGELFFFGEDDTSGNYKSFRYDGTNWTDLSAEMGIAEFNEVDSYYEEDGKIYMTGGVSHWDETMIVEYDGTNWTDLSPHKMAELSTVNITAEMSTALTAQTGYSNISLNTEAHFYEEGSADKFIVTGTDNDTGDAKIFEYDGTNWTDIGDVVGQSNVEDLYKVIVVDDMLMIEGWFDDGSTSNYLFSVRDETGWRNIPAELGSTGFELEEIRQYGDTLFLGGYDCDIGESRLVTYDGENWTNIDSVAGGIGFYISDFYEYGDAVFIEGEEATNWEGRFLLYEDGNYTDVGEMLGSDNFWLNSC
ncbi:MAG: flagellin N-terminal helical domain-containing protein [Alphaproteobacteria bacterium]